MKFEGPNKLVAAGASALMLSGFGAERSSVLHPASQAVSSEMEAAQTYQPRTLPELVSLLHYDALKDRRPQQQYEFKTTRSLTRLFNLTGENIAEPEIKDLVVLFESLAAKGGSFSLQAKLRNGHQERLNYLIQPKAEHYRYIMVVPPKTPLYSIPPGTFTDSHGAAYTLDYPSADAMVTIARQPQLNQSRLKLQTAKEFLYTELCQSTYNVKPQTINNAGGFADIQRLGQEDVCNSVDEALVLAARGSSYEEYRKMASGRKVVVPGIGSAKYLVADKKTYARYQQIVH